MLSLTSPALANAADSGFLTRVDQTGENGFVRSYMIDEENNLYTDNDANDSEEADTLTVEAASASFEKKKSAADNSSQTASGSAVSLLPSASGLPTSYDSRLLGLITPIKNQGITGCCWAFSALKTLEAFSIKKGLFTKEQADFSENHLAWFSYRPSTDASDPLYGDGITSVNQGNSYSSTTRNDSVGLTVPYENGGSSILASFTLAKWSGPELEQNAPFAAGSNGDLTNMASFLNARTSLQYSSYAHLQNAFSFDEYTVGQYYYYQNPSMISEIKQAIMDNGALSMALYYDKNYLYESPNGTNYYQTYYTGNYGVKNANHCITVVGWDDNYSRDNFRGKPSGDGAWLIANSYGTTSGDEGYFWLSYYDTSICDCYVFQAERADNYDAIYQYDGFGWNNANYADTYNIKAANVFTASNTSPQRISAVSFYTLSNNQQVKIQIYRKVSGSPTNGVLISESTTTETIAQNGYHTVTLRQPVNVAAGECFSVVVTYIRSGSSKIYVPLEGPTSTDSTFTIVYSSKSGQSFLFTKLSTGGSRVWQDTSEIGYNNVCIKAFAKNTTGADSLPSVIKTVTLGKGETWQLPKKYKSYQSSDTNLVSVSASGKVTAKTLGTTKIQVSDGESSYLIKVKIKKAPTKIRLKPSGNVTLKKGKHLKLKYRLSSGSASKKVRFRSSTPRVATVSSTGKVTAKHRGTTTIRIRTYNGRTARLKVTVK